MSAAGVGGCEVLLQSEQNDLCGGYVDVGLSRPARILIRAGDDDVRRRAELLGHELDRVLATVGVRIEAADMPCRSFLRRPCAASGEPQTVNLLVWVGSDREPGEGEELAAQQWLSSRPDAIAIPIVPEAADPDRVLPPALRHTNVVRWRGPAAVAQDVLDAVDPDALERRVFVSYSHADGADEAHAVARVLTEARFSTFLDAISLRPGADFAERIEQELMDKAFLVLIETPAAMRSEWVVRRELRFARLHRLGIAAVRPQGSTARRAWGIGARRWTLPSGALELGGSGGPALRSGAARSLRDFVVTRHDEALLRRRRVVEEGLRLMLSVEGAAGVSGEPGGLGVEAGGRAWHVGIRPRPASLLDMRDTDGLVAGRDGGVMVSPTPPGGRERDALAWLSAKSAIPRWDEGRLRSLAQALNRGSP